MSQRKEKRDIKKIMKKKKAFISLTTLPTHGLMEYNKPINEHAMTSRIRDIMYPPLPLRA